MILKEHKFINIHTHNPNSCADNISILNYAPNISFPDKAYFSYGIHPWDIENHNIETINFDRYVSPNNCIAIGETGIDKTISTKLYKQVMVFEKHISISEKYKKPLIIHCVKAHSEILELHKIYKPTQAWILHAYANSIQMTRNLVDKGLYFSMGMRELSRSKGKKDFIHSIPLSKLFFETDNSKQSIQEVYIEASKKLNTAIDQLIEITTINFHHCFNFSI
ncbi:MAG: hydrolase TatD [Marinilabiliales bacterium]|nr:MAG: hydrolase TatD [Marinilabiliales bacterium]